MGRLLILLGMAVAVVWWVSSRVRAARGRSRQPNTASTAAPAVRDMVSCAHCGVHLPRDEAVVDGERLFCGEGHRRLGPRGG